MASLSQALRLGDLPPPHRTFQGHATHIIEWSMMLRPNDSWSTCILQGIATFLHYASRRSAGYRYIYGPTRAVKEVSSEKNTLRDRCSHISGLLVKTSYGLRALMKSALPRLITTTASRALYLRRLGGSRSDRSCHQLDYTSHCADSLLHTCVK
jgi:hypothetical protein